MYTQLQKISAGTKRPAAACSDNMSTPRKRLNLNAKSPKISPLIGQVTVGAKIPPNGHQVQCAISEQILSSAKKRLFEKLPDSQSIIEEAG